MKSTSQDERIVAQKRKIGNEAFLVLFFGLLISVLVQQYLFNAPFSQYAAEVIFMIIASVYIIIRSIMVGDNLFGNVKNSQKNVILTSLLCGLSITVINTTVNSIKLGESFTKDIGNTLLISLVTFIFATIACLVLFEIVFAANKERQKKLDEKYKDEDE